jgi:hypothetical protein
MQFETNHSFASQKRQVQLPQIQRVVYVINNWELLWLAFSVCVIPRNEQHTGFMLAYMICVTLNCQ